MMIPIPNPQDILMNRIFFLLLRLLEDIRRKPWNGCHSLYRSLYVVFPQGFETRASPQSKNAIAISGERIYPSGYINANA